MFEMQFVYLFDWWSQMFSGIPVKSNYCNWDISIYYFNNSRLESLIFVPFSVLGYYS